MPEEEDYSQLAVEDQISHSAWKARMAGYTALVAQFEASRNDQDPCFALFANRPDQLRLLITDSNVVAQEQGLLAVCKFLEYGPASGGALRSANLVAPICEKGLASSRAGTKAKAAEALLLMAEITGSADWIVDTLALYFENRLPKLVAACVNACQQLVAAFGVAVAQPKALFPYFPKLFAHADRNVRAETTKLVVELYRWMGDGLRPLVVDGLKPVQQKDLATEFDKVKGTRPEPTRLTRAQRAEQQHQTEEPTHSDSAMDVEPDAPFDPYSMLNPVEVLSKLPADLSTRLASSLWKDRKEVLEEALAVLAKAPKLAPNDDYTDLVRLLGRCMKDANIQVVQLAANAVEHLARGLKAHFQKYQGLVLAPMVERLKEKKPSVADALNAALDSVFASSSLHDVLEDTLAGMRHKTPQVKIASCNFLLRCLAETPLPPSTPQVDSIMNTAVKLLSDSQESVRQAAAECIGTLMKITGERELRQWLEKVDDNRSAKVRAACESAVVKAKTKTGSAAPPKAARPPLSGPPPAARAPQPKPKLQLKPAPINGQASHLKPAPVNGQASHLKPGLGRSGVPSLDPTLAIPAKRTATSPAKRPEASTKIPVRLTRTLNPPAGGDISEELQALQAENEQLRKEIELHQNSHNTDKQQMHALSQELAALRNELLAAQSEAADSKLMVKQKDMQITRLNNDLENAKLKIKSWEQTIEMMKLKQSTQDSPFRSPRKETPTELSSRVHRLSIEGETAQNVTHERSVGTEEENWRKAAEVTAQLKARIEKMKQRNRLVSR